MPRSPRVVEPGGIYHLTPRGNDGRILFLEDADREQFLLRLALVAARYRWIVLAYCLMDTHVHLLVQVPEGGLSAGMQVLLGGYSRWWNTKHGHFGHLWRNRFDSKHVRDQRHLVATARYIDLNRVLARACFRPEQWKWSSYLAHVGQVHPPPFLRNAPLLELFGATPANAFKAYRRFVAEGRSAVSDDGGGGPEVRRGSGRAPRLVSPPSGPPRAPPG